MSPLIREAIRLDNQNFYRDDIAAGWSAHCESLPGDEDDTPTTS